MKQLYHIPYNFEAVGKNIKRRRGEGDGIFGEENQDLKDGGWGRISSCRELYTPLNLIRGIPRSGTT